MRAIFETTITGAPTAKGRPRFTRSGRVYTPKKTRDAEKHLSVHLSCLVGGKKQYPFTGPIYVEFEFYIKRPKNLFRKIDPDGPIPHTKKPDLDNLIKLVKDAANKIIWSDDAIICDMRPKKFYCSKTGKPRTIIRVYQCYENT
jgi:Holliday junction resolvase RusA-like endonuclease